jgi:ligand-binding SRPBCC domain-containing protein
MDTIYLKFQTIVSAPIEEVWEWITSLKGIQKEMMPYFKMTAPKGIKTINDVKIELGKPLFRSHIYLFGFLPIGHDDMTLIEYTEGKGFIEQSPMASMELWRHQRDIEKVETGTMITDQLTFKPRHASKLISKFLRRVFRHRHNVIKKKLEKR